ncbi:MAG: bifunctional oligoribonuclease/PAP phosphatase NrnA [bacterium]|nr:bifunctional oligoribonuclease/PAP phosphatase NrnA [bacterium]
MYKKIYKAIKKFDTIVISRHVGVDPDAMASQIALRDSILLTFPKKRVLAVGNGSNKFSYIGKLDKLEDVDFSRSLLIVLDTPDKKRVDCFEVDRFAYKIKIDHHLFVEKFCDIELIDVQTSSTSQLILELLYSTKLKRNVKIISNLFLGLVSDTNRFLFNVNADTFSLISKVLSSYSLDLPALYQNLYRRPLSEVRLEGYISQNMTVTENGVGYIKITNDIINKFEADVASAGNMVNNFNYIEEVLVWLMISEDRKNHVIKINIRSRGPIINTIAEKYNGGGHKFACGAKLTTFEEVDLLIQDLDYLCEKYIESMD